jgi:hypothetical protein
MPHTHPTHAHRSESGAGRTPRFTSEPSLAAYLGKTSEPALPGPHSGPGSCDFDALDWLRFWLPESDWHIRRARAERRI